jgi:hypothetical protein
LYHHRTTLHHGFTSVCHHQLIQTTDKLFLVGVLLHLLQSDPVIIVSFLAVHDITVREVHTLTTGTFRFGVVINEYNIETTNVNLRCLVTRTLVVMQIDVDTSECDLRKGHN